MYKFFIKLVINFLLTLNFKILNNIFFWAFRFKDARQKKMAKLESQLSELTNEVGSLTVKLNSAEAQRQQLAVRNTDLTSSLGDMSNERDQLRGRVRLLETDVRQLNAQVEELTNLMSTNSPDIDALHKRCQELASQASNTRRIECENEELRGKVGQLEQALRSNSVDAEQMRSLREENSRLR